MSHEVLADFKASVDDLRLRLWGLLTAGTDDDRRAFPQRFRVRRAARSSVNPTERRKGEASSPAHDGP